MIILSILVNHFKNLYLSILTQQKINQRPEELLYKRLLIIYLAIIGTLIFFFNDLHIIDFPLASVLALVLSLGFIIILLKIKPYKQSLRIHQISIIIHHLFYAVFLVVINLINFLNVIS